MTYCFMRFLAIDVHFLGTVVKVCRLRGSQGRSQQLEMQTLKENQLNNQERIQGTHGRMHSIPYSPLRSRTPVNQLEVWRSAVSSPSGVRGSANAENEFGAFWSCQKATGGNHFEYSEVHVSYYVE